MRRTDILERKEEILTWISEGRPKAFICSQVDCKPETLENALKVFGVFYRGDQGFGNRNKEGRKKSLSELLNSDMYKSSHRIKLKMLDEGFKDHRCEKCNHIEWLGEPIPLELDHKDGNRNNWNINNVWLLCPNCHAQQPTNSGKNKRGRVVKLGDALDLDSSGEIRVGSSPTMPTNSIKEILMSNSKIRDFPEDKSWNKPIITLTKVHNRGGSRII